MIALGSYYNVGKIYQPPRVKYWGENETPNNTTEDELYLDPRTRTYKTYNQEKKIQELEEQINEKKLKRKNELQEIIGYFYKLY